MDMSYKLKLKYFVSIIFLLLVCTVVHGESQVSEVLEKVVENNNQYSEGMSVPYKREILTKSMAMLDDIGFDKAAGVFFFKGPNLLKVEQQTPSTEFVISNGKNIWWYLPEKKTAYRFDDMGKELSILCMIFTGIKNPEDTFSITGTGSDTADEYKIILIPNESWEEIDNIKVTVSSEDFRITRIEINDLVGNLTRFKLGEFERKNDMDDSFFDFKVPEDVKVIEEEQ